VKYIIIQPPGIDYEFAITFPETIQHKDALSERIKGVAAGFYKTNPDGSITAWGKSNSLNLRSRGELDAVVILFSESMPSIHEPEPEPEGELLTTDR
jgi:hypothetical protein